MQYNILLVEDDLEISELVKGHLESEHYSVVPAFDGEEALKAIENNNFDLVLLDVMLPKVNGMEVLKLVRSQSVVPILIISAKGSDLDKALGLGFGADDYISKPFSMIELTARVQAAIRRSQQYGQPVGQDVESHLHYNDLILDLHNFTVIKNGETISLTGKEFSILKLFMTNNKRVFTKEEIYYFCWQDDYFGNENVINVHIRRLREKIEDNPSNPKYIRTVWGIGYRLGE